jgi:hypothetical protein
MHPVFLYCSWQLVLQLSSAVGSIYPSFYIQGGEVIRKVIELVII